MADGSQDAEDMDLVIRETKRCASIIRRLLDFAREKPPEKKFADLNQIIEDTARLVERPANLRDIAITLDLDRTLPQVWVDPDQIKQVVMNLLVNAQHAIDGEGSIIIRTRRLPQPRTPQSGAIAVPMVEFSVTDTGCGIPEENFRRIFDPFFTTKSRNRERGWDCPSATGSSRPMAVRSKSKARWGRDPHSGSISLSSGRPKSWKA